MTIDELRAKTARANELADLLGKIDGIDFGGSKASLRHWSTNSALIEDDIAMKAIRLGMEEIKRTAKSELEGILGVPAENAA